MAGDSDSDGGPAAGRGVTVTADDVRVEKTFERDEFPVPVVSFRLTSEAAEPVEIRLTDEVPETLSMEQVGFHPDFDSDDWTAYRDHRVEYVTTLDPGAEVRTVYGVRLDEGVDAESFLGEPRLDRRDETDDADPDDVLGRETNQLVRDALAGDDVPGVDGSLAADDGAVGEGVKAPAPRPVPDGLSPTVTDRGVTTDPTDDTAGAADVESVAAALAAEIRAGDVDDDDLAALRDGLDAGRTGRTGVPKSVDVRIKRVQARLSDVEAYGNAMEAFLDENGTGQELIEGFRTDVARLEDDVAAVEDGLDAVRDGQETLGEDVADLDAELTERTDALETELAAQAEELDSRVAALRADLEADVATVREDLSALEAEVTEAEVAEAEDVAELEAELADVRDQLEDLRAFRDRMRDAFGQ